MLPGIWKSVSYSSLKPLSSWFKDMIARVNFIREWLNNKAPLSYWMSGFYFPQGFLTGVLQTHARLYKIPIDTLNFKFKVLPIEKDKLTSWPEVFILWFRMVCISMACTWMGRDGMQNKIVWWIKFWASCISRCLWFTFCQLKILYPNIVYISVRATRHQTGRVCYRRQARVLTLFCLWIWILSLSMLISGQCVVLLYCVSSMTEWLFYLLIVIIIFLSSSIKLFHLNGGVILKMWGIAQIMSE